MMAVYRDIRDCSLEVISRDADNVEVGQFLLSKKKKKTGKLRVHAKKKSIHLLQVANSTQYFLFFQLTVG